MTRQRLDRELVRRRLAPSRSEARRLVEEGVVVVGGIPSPKASTLVGRDIPIDVVEPGPGYVSRGALKLEAALDTFGIDPKGRRVLDAGASTGGFTDVLLRRGARQVMALDVGYGQLDDRLRRRSEVVVMERTNVRHVSPDDTGGRFDLIVADLSFISLCTVAPALARLSEPGADLVLLVKPQFEAGRDEVGKGGIVRDDETRRHAVVSVVECLDRHGLGALMATPSVIPGAKGNREVFLWCQQGVPARVDRSVLA